MFVAEAIRSWGWSVKDHENDHGMQISGVDLSIKKPTWHSYYTVDVKGNMRDDMSFYIETTPKGWLFNPKKNSNRVWHVNVHTGWMAWYDREKMKAYVTSLKLGSKEFTWVSKADQLSFVTWSKHGK